MGLVAREWNLVPKYTPPQMISQSPYDSRPESCWPLISPLCKPSISPIQHFFLDSPKWYWYMPYGVQESLLNQTKLKWDGEFKKVKQEKCQTRSIKKWQWRQGRSSESIREMFFAFKQYLYSVLGYLETYLSTLRLKPGPLLYILCLFRMVFFL